MTPNEGEEYNENILKILTQIWFYKYAHLRELMHANNTLQVAPWQWRHMSLWRIKSSSY